MKKNKSIGFLNLPAQHRKLKQRLLARIGKIIDSAHFILGPETKALEKEIAALCQVQYAWGLNSGTDALILALRALEIGPGDEVLVPDYTFVATASAVLLVGATPVMVDIEPETYGIDLKQIPQKITRKTKAIIPVHLYGQMVDMTRLRTIAKKYGLAIVEDAAQALGAAWNKKPAGTLGDIGCISFFPTKNLGALGDAGMVVTNDPDLSRRLNRLRQHGAERKYYHDELGLNSRLDEIQAAALRIKLPYFAAWNNRRRAIARMYTQGLKTCPVVLPTTRSQAVHVYHQYAIRTPQRDALQVFLQEQGIGTAIHYPLALHQQPMLARVPSARNAYPVSTAVAREVLCLPIAPELTQAEVRSIIKAIRAFWKK